MEEALRTLRNARSPQDDQLDNSIHEVWRPTSSHSTSSIGATVDDKRDDSRFERLLHFSKKATKDTGNIVVDETQGIKKLFGGTTRHLCSACKQIPFAACLPRANQSGPADVQRNEPLVFCMSLSHILNHKKWCKFCSLLFRSCCEPQNDLLKAKHIQKYLQDSRKLKGIETFREWAEAFPNWRHTVEGEDIWPFGYSIDHDEAAKNALGRARELFQSSEHEDINTESLEDGIMNNYQDRGIPEVVQAVDLGAEIAGLATSGHNAELQKAMTIIQMTTSKLSALNYRMRKRLPCLFVIRAYRPDEMKAGALSVRIYGHGRGPLAPLRQICHFSLRFEGKGEPRTMGQQIWYGRGLGHHVDVEFFKTCVKACQSLHKDCINQQWTANTLDILEDEKVPLRLIDV